MNKIRTKRLQLISSSVELAKAELKDRLKFAELLGAKVPENWPPELNNLDTIEYNLQKLEEGSEQEGWWCWYFILCQETPILIGNGGFKGLPVADGTAEIGYSIMKEFQNQGYATEATKSLINWAFTQKKVKRIIAETFPELKASIRVLEKCGFKNIGEGSEAGVIRFAL